MSNVSDLQQNAEIIKNETSAGQNSASRVGTFLVSLLSAITGDNASLIKNISIRSTATSLLLVIEKFNGTTSNLQIPISSTTSSGAMSAEDKIKLEQQSAVATPYANGLMSKSDKINVNAMAYLFKNDILLRTDGITFENVNNNQWYELGSFHLNEGECFYVESNTESTITIKNDHNTYSGTKDVEAGAYFDEMQGSTYEHWMFKDTHGQAGDITFKIVKQ